MSNSHVYDMVNTLLHMVKGYKSCSLVHRSCLSMPLKFFSNRNIAGIAFGLTLRRLTVMSLMNVFYMHGTIEGW